MTLQQNLIQWFRTNQRPLPWRKRYEPYEVWVSEIMLQQTQMETVLPYFNRWLKAFPTLEALAKAESKQVLKLWEGLGYYSRARNLHEGAKTILQTRGGLFPDNYDEILSIKGIGRYTAGAIASIAFNQDKPIVDGNILRVLSRVYAISKPIDIEKNKVDFWKLQEVLLPKGNARDFNQALMELGALVCRAQNPSCSGCPLRQFCKAFKQGNPENYPVKSKRKKMVKVEAASLVLEKNGKYLVWLRPLGKIMGGLWEFPEWKLSRNKKLGAAVIRNKTSRLAMKEFGLRSGSILSLGKIKRNYTNHLETLHVFRTVQTKSSSVSTKTSWQSEWVSKEDFKKYPFSSAHAKIIKLLPSRVATGHCLIGVQTREVTSGPGV
jgi:A/G-specific adenine glycosylase